MILQQLKQKKLEEFEKTKFAKGGGYSFECSDYEGMYDDLKSFLSSAMDEIQNATIEAAQGEIGKMKCDERQIHTFGEWIAVTHNEKELVDAALSQSHSALNNLKTK